MTDLTSPQQNDLLNLLVKILDEYGRHHESQKNLTFNCPTCAELKNVEYDNKYNLEVNYGMGIYNCWACGKTHGTHGTLLSLVNKFGTINDVNIYKALNLTFEYKNKDGDDVVRENKDIYLPTDFISLKNKRVMNVYRQAFNYLDKRGVTDKIIDKYSIGWCHSGKYENRILIPSITDEGNLDYYVTRAFDKNKVPKYLNCEKDKELIVFNENLINWDKIVFLVEGPFDHIITPNSIPMLGKVLYPLLKRTIYKNANNRIIIITDPDAQNDGIDIYRELDGGRLLGKILINFLPEGYDPAKFFSTFGFEKYKEQLKNSVRLID